MTDPKNILIVISTILVLTSPLVYIHSIINGETRPHRTTRFVLLVITLLSTAALWQTKGAAFWLALASLVQALIVFILSIKKGMGGWSRVDIGCLIIALVGIVLWQTSGQPAIGLLASIVADVVGMVPALIKTYKLPHTEDWRFFAMDTAAGVLSTFALTSYTIYTLSYPLYIVVINAAMVALILIPRHKIAHKPGD